MPWERNTPEVQVPESRVGESAEAAAIVPKIEHHRAIKQKGTEEFLMKSVTHRSQCHIHLGTYPAEV